jgi:hypothetical protein
VIKTLSLATVLFLTACACTTTKVEPLVDCVDAAKKWAEQGAEQVQALPDGGLVAARSDITGKIELFVIVSDKQAAKFLSGAKEQGAKVREAGKCAHPQSGYPYNAIQLELQQTPEEV